VTGWWPVPPFHKHSNWKLLCCDISSSLRPIFIIIICLGLVNFFPNYKRNPCSL
jgi:hypothetical protein